MSFDAQHAARTTAFRRAVLAGVIFPLSAAPFDLPVLAFAIAPLMVLAIDAEAGTTLRRAAFLGFAWGFFLHVITFAWFGPMIVVHGRLPYAIGALAAVLLFASAAIPYAFAALLARTASRAGVPLTLAMPPAIAVSFALAPMMFPFRPSTSMVEFLPFAQVADLGGATALDFATAAVGCAILEAMRTRRPTTIAIALVCLAAPLAYGSARIEDIEAARRQARVIRVGIVQPNISIADKHNIRRRRQTMFALRTLTAQAERDGADLVVWPETSYPYRVPRDTPHDVIGDAGIRRGGLVRGPVIFGLVTGTDGCDQANSVLGMRRDGTFTGPVDKARLLPLVETFPGWRESGLLRRIRPCFGYVPAPSAGVIALPGLRVGIMNCYEDLLGVHARELSALAPDFVLNVTNDAWFLDSQEPHIHHMAARVRAIEMRRDLVRSVNTGVSGLISATGERLSQTATYVPAAPVVEVAALTGTTFYATHGDVFLYASLALLALSLAAARLGAFRSATQAE